MNNSAPVKAMSFNDRFNVMVSGDARGGLEYWSCKTFKAPKKVVKFRLKVRFVSSYGVAASLSAHVLCCQSESDLFALNKAKTSVSSISFSPNGMSFVVTSTDFQIRVFNYVTGKLRRVYDESTGVYEDAHEAKTLGIDDLDYGRRMAVERDLRNSTSVPPSNAIFDQTSNFLLCVLLARGLW